MTPRVVLATARTHPMLSGRPTGSPSMCVSRPIICCMIAGSAPLPVVHANGSDTGWSTLLHGLSYKPCSTLITAAYSTGCSTPRRSWYFTTWTTWPNKQLLIKSPICGAIAPPRASRASPRSTLDRATYTVGPRTYDISPNISPDSLLTIDSSASPPNALVTETCIDIRVAPGSQLAKPQTTASPMSSPVPHRTDRSNRIFVVRHDVRLG